jgi:hypothetical protein
MSTICKLDPMTRQRRAMRAALLRNPPRLHGNLEASAIMAELALIHRNPRLSGVVKQKLFERGAYQLSRLTV